MTGLPMRIFTLPNGRQLRQVAADRWECQPPSARYWCAAATAQAALHSAGWDLDPADLPEEPPPMRTARVWDYLDGDRLRAGYVHRGDVLLARDADGTPRVLLAEDGFISTLWVRNPRLQAIPSGSLAQSL